MWRRCSTRAIPRPTRPRCRRRQPATLWCARPAVPPLLPSDVPSAYFWPQMSEYILLFTLSGICTTFSWRLVPAERTRPGMQKGQVRCHDSPACTLSLLVATEAHCSALAWPGAGPGQLHAARDALHAGHRAVNARHAEAGRHAPRAVHHAAGAARPRRRPCAGPSPPPTVLRGSLLQ